MGYALLTGLLCDEIESTAQQSSQQKTAIHHRRHVSDLTHQKVTDCAQELV